MTHALPDPTEPSGARVVCEVRGLGLQRSTPDGRTITVLDDLDLTVTGGTVTAVQGRSGSGKTSLLHCMAGMLRPTAGHIRLLGDDIWELDERHRARLRSSRIALVRQDAGMIDMLTAVENVLMAFPDRKTARARTRAATDALAAVGLADRARHRPHQLSSGQRQRVAFARALVVEPDLLLVDEPTAALDTASARVIIDLLASITAQHGMATLVASHDHAVLDAADRVLPLPE